MSRSLVLFSSLPEVGGHATTTIKLCELLRGDFDRVVILAKDMPGHGRCEATAAALREMGARVVFLTGGAMAALVTARRVVGQPDVFLAMGMRHLSPLLAATLRPRLSIYYHITHELGPRQRLQLGLYRRFFDRIVFLSPSTWTEFGRRKRSSWALQPTEIAGADTTIRTRPPGPFRLGFLGRLSSAKGARILLDFIATSPLDCLLLVAGKGELEGEIRRAAMHGRVEYLGSYGAAGRAAFLGSFFERVDTLCALSQDDREGMPNVLLEAMQYGVPSIATAAGGTRALALPELGPVPREVVRLIPRGAEVSALAEAVMAGPPSDEARAACRSCFARTFSDAALRARWQALTSSGSPPPETRRVS